MQGLDGDRVASDVVAAKGEAVCVAVKTKDFEQILSMQYSMNWNPNWKKSRASGWRKRRVRK